MGKKYNYYRSSSTEPTWGVLGVQFALLVAYYALSMAATSSVFHTLTGKDINGWLNALLAIFIGPASFTIWIVVAVLQAAGVHFPVM